MFSVTESSSDFDQEREERMRASDGASEEALERSLYEWIPFDVAAATVVLREAKQILDNLGVVFFLRQGTCLGAIRDHGFIPWDDDLDMGSVIGLHGFSEKSVDRVVAAFRKNGFFARVEHQDQCIYVSMIKSAVRTDWMCYRIIDDSIFHYPGTRIPVRLLTNLKEIEFIGEKFYVPNPPDEYLRLKYGEEWMIPKKTGFEKDVLDLIPEAPLPGRAGRLKQFLIKHVMPWRTSRLRILNHKGEPVAGADVVVAGLGRSRTDRQGYARIYLPYEDFYALVIRFGEHEEVLYEEKMNTAKTYVYRPDPQVTSGRYFVLSLERDLREP
jgi:hypothetical protein